MTGLDSPRPTPVGVPKVEVNAACPSYNQQLKVSNTGETVTNNGAVLQQIIQNFIRLHTVLRMEVIWNK
jgi:hypothetical protein